MWKCGNVEICLPCLNLSSNSGSVEMWKYVFIVLIYHSQTHSAFYPHRIKASLVDITVKLAGNVINDSHFFVFTDIYIYIFLLDRI